MIDKCKSKLDCYDDYHKRTMCLINIKWIIGVLVFIIMLLLTHGFWGKPYPLQDLITVGMGFASIFLTIFTIFYSFVENIKTSQKEYKVDNLLNNIENNVKTVHEVLGQVQNITKATNTKVGIIEEFIQNVEKQAQYETKQEELEDAKPKQEQEQEPKRELKPKREQIKQEELFSNIKRGNIYLASIDENNTIRPVIVISNNMINKYSPQINVIPMTSSIRKTKLPTHVFIEALERPSVALVELVFTIKKSQLGAQLATLDAKEISELEKAFMILVGKRVS
jgi:Growth inhibitor